MRVRRSVRDWSVPLAYVLGSLLLAWVVPPFEIAHFPDNHHLMSVASAQAFLSATASGMMALTAIVFSFVFLAIQFGATAYSKRFTSIARRNSKIFHTLGMCFATFVYALATLASVDRGGSGLVPYWSTMMVTAFLATSLVLLALMTQDIANLQVTRVLRLIGNLGREVIAASPKPRTDPARIAELKAAANLVEAETPAQVVRYSGTPMAVAEYDVDGLVRLAQANGCVIRIDAAVGDTLAFGTVLARLYGGGQLLTERDLLRRIWLARERTFEQDPKYPLRIIVDTAIMALSPAINDPTTAVQALDEIQDLLRRLSSLELEAWYVTDSQKHLRVIAPMPTWDDYLSLALDEIRLCGAESPQVIRRMRALLRALRDALPDGTRHDSVERYREHLDATVGTSGLDAVDRLSASREDPQGLGSTRE